MKKCSYAKKYRGLRVPKCNKGAGCDACNAKYLAKHPPAAAPKRDTFMDIPFIHNPLLGDKIFMVRPAGAHLRPTYDYSAINRGLTMETIGPRDYTSAERKEAPVQTVMAEYFPDAFMALARHSKKANDKHNPGEPLHWARHKSNDHLNCAGRHLLTPDAKDPDTGEIEAVCAMWRLAAYVQLSEEKRLRAAGIKPLSGK